MCNKCVGDPNSSSATPALLHFFKKMSRGKPEPNAGNCNRQHNFCEGDNKSSEQASPASEMEICFVMLKDKFLAWLRYWNIFQ